LPPQDGEVIHNLDLLGLRVTKPLKDNKPANQPLFPRKPPLSTQQNEDSFSRFEPNLKMMLEDQIRGTLDSTLFPFTRPQADQDDGMMQDQLAQSSLRSAKPTWARTRASADQPRQRLIVFMAGGASYAESRTCYEISNTHSKDVYLATSHMLTPGLFLRQVGDLSVDKRQLDILAERPKPVAPAHLFEQDAPQPPAKPTPPTGAMASVSLNRPAPASNGPSVSPAPTGKVKKEKEKKKLGFFRS
jgi:syntaxin-binding protein 1